MYKIKNFTPRPYQSEIAETSKNKNTLLVLPTGTGKTKTAILTAIERLNKYHPSNILMITPTKPLAAQIQKEFIESTTIPQDQIILLTGAILPKKRQELWESAVVTIATPQTAQKDIDANRISLSPTSLLVIDECHKSRINFANTKVSQKYMQQSKYPRILALTASPGGSKQKIYEIKKNLSIESIEIRTEEDIKEFIQEKNIRWLEIDFSEPLQEINNLIKTAYNEKLKNLRKLGFTKPLKLITKKDIIGLQQQLRKNLSRRNPIDFYGISLTALLIKMDYASELLETQGIQPVTDFWKKLEKDTTKAAKTILKIPQIKKAISLTESLIEQNIKHPKLYVLKGLITKELRKNPSSKIIVFANYRSTIKEILEFINKEEVIKATKLIGQKEGLSQKEQIQTIDNFERGKFNVLVGTSIMEEGLDIKSGAELAIFYDIMPSEIRTIQRKGRVGRTKTGSIIFLMTNNTREQGYRWSAYHKEKRMKNILQNMQKETQLNLYETRNNN